MFEDDLIYDVGMHRAEDTEFYLAKGFRVIAVEASPELCAAAADRLRSYVDSGQLTIVQAAVADKEGPVDLYLNPRSEWNTIRPDLVGSQRRPRLAVGARSSASRGSSSTRCSRPTARRTT